MPVAFVRSRAVPVKWCRQGKLVKGHYCTLLLTFWGATSCVCLFVRLFIYMLALSLLAQFLGAHNALKP